MKGDSFDNYRILLTKVDSRKTRTNTAVMAALEPWTNMLCTTQIPQSEPLNQAQMARQDIYSFDGTSTGAVAYQELLKELTSSL